MRRFVLPVAFAATAAAFLAAPPDARSQSDKKFEDLKQSTADGVQLSCRYYKGSGSGSGAAVILMHNYQQDPNKGGWDDLAGTLAGAGYHVFRPDFRGHGNSKDVDAKTFYANPFNQRYVTGGTKAVPPKIIDAKNFKSNYFPALVNDLAATRTLIDKMQGSGVNNSTIYLIGAQEMTALGFLFLAAEWNRDAEAPQSLLPNARPQVVVAGRRPGQSPPAGKDYAGCVWLTPSRPQSLPTAALENLVSRYGQDRVTNKGDLRADNHMLFLYGAKDDKGKKDAGFYFNEVLVSRGKAALKVDSLEFNYLRPVENTEARGVALLGKNAQLKTEDTIQTFLKDMDKQRGKLPAFDRKNNAPLYIEFGSFGVGG
jgi:hypothetical protein